MHVLILRLSFCHSFYALTDVLFSRDLVIYNANLVSVQITSLLLNEIVNG